MIDEELTVDRLGVVDGKGVLCLRGPLTMSNVTPFQNAIRREENAATVILDLSDVPYVDSAGLGSLVGAYISRHKAGRQIVLAGVNERVLKLFRITRVEPLFLIFPALEDAIAALTSAGQA